MGADVGEESREALRGSVVVIGPSGSGKSTLGRALALRLAVPFVDADDHHSEENLAKMARGEGLTDEDREGWLAALASVLREATRLNAPIVLACSALRARYRKQLREASPRLAFVYLEVPRSELERRLEARAGHFAGASLLPSQLATWERPVEAITVDGTGPVDELVERVLMKLGSV